MNSTGIVRKLDELGKIVLPSGTLSMRFIQKWSYAFAFNLAIKLNDNHQKRSVYYYGFFLVIGALVKGIILISVALLFGALIPSLLIVFIFGSLRMFAGGYHMDTYGKCLFVSLGLFVAAALIVQYTFQYWNLISIAILITLTFIIGLYVLIRYAPKDTPNKPITDPKDVKKYKKLSLIYLFIYLAISVILAAFRLKMYVMAMSFGVLLELFAVTPTGHRFFNTLKNKLNKKVVKN